MIVVLDNGYCQQNVIPKLEEIVGNVPDWLGDYPPEDVLWGIGVGGLSTTNASCEQAKFNAQSDICRQLSMYLMHVENSHDDPSFGHTIAKLNLYQNEFYTLLSIEASNQTTFELSEFIKIDKRTKTADGSIWYRVYLTKYDAEKFGTMLSQ
jgi:hypothetical protein